jgi:hypothetical protein
MTFALRYHSKSDYINANAMMSLGEFRHDRMQRITGGFWDFAFQEANLGTGNGAFYVDQNFSSAKFAPSSIQRVSDTGDGFWFDSSRVTRTGQHTEPINTVFNGFIVFC